MADYSADHSLREIVYDMDKRLQRLEEIVCYLAGAMLSAVHPETAFHGDNYVATMLRLQPLIEQLVDYDETGMAVMKRDRRQ